MPPSFVCDSPSGVRRARLGSFGFFGVAIEGRGQGACSPASPAGVGSFGILACRLRWRGPLERRRGAVYGRITDGEFGVLVAGRGLDVVLC